MKYRSMPLFGARAREQGTQAKILCGVLGVIGVF